MLNKIIMSISGDHIFRSSLVTFVYPRNMSTGPVVQRTGHIRNNLIIIPSFQTLVNR